METVMPEAKISELRRASLPPQGGFQLAHIVSVTGSQAVMVLEQTVIGLGAELGRAKIGTVVKIKTPQADVMGLISGLSTPDPGSDSATGSLRVAELDLVGEIAGAPGGARRFRRGVSGLPVLGDPVFMAERDDLECIYSAQGRAHAQIGTLYQDESIPVHVLVDELFSKHFAIVGSTGSGKSCALAGIVLSVLEQSPHAHIVILDLHNEYGTVFEQCAELITPASLALPFWMLNAQELAMVIIGSDTPDEDEAEILNEAVQHAKRRYAEAARHRAAASLRKLSDTPSIGFDAPTPFRLNDVVGHLDEQMGKLERSRSVAPYRRIKARIEALTADTRYGFMFGGGVTVQDSMVEILSRIFRIPAAGKPVTVLDLSAIPSEVLNAVISTICRITFDLGVWSRGQLPITLICEEAHRYAPRAAGSAFEPTRRALARIAKEGRKYAISLGLVTQRPSELDPTVLSQCSTVFALRLSSEADQEVIRAATADNAQSLMSFLPSLGDGQAIAVGQGITVPMRVRFTTLPERIAPASECGRFSKAWGSEGEESAAFLEQVIARWRANGRSDA
jgi:Helicase HerA, central domain